MWKPRLRLHNFYWEIRIFLVTSVLHVNINFLCYTINLLWYTINLLCYTIISFDFTIIQVVSNIQHVNYKKSFQGLNKYKSCSLLLLLQSLWAPFSMSPFLAYWLIGHKLLAWPGVGGGGVVVNNFSSLFSLETTAQNTSKLYIQLPHIGVYKNSSFHVDPIVDVDFIGFWKF